VITTKWQTQFSPISADAYGARARWEKYKKEKLEPHIRNLQERLDPELIPFYHDYDKDVAEDKLFNQHREAYKKVHDWHCANVQEYLQFSDWTRAESVRAMAVEPLHCLIRISGHVLKYVIVQTVMYVEWIADPINEEFKRLNHAADYVPPSVQKWLKHVRQCCGIPLRYNYKNPTASTITAGTAPLKLWSPMIVCTDQMFVTRGRLEKTIVEAIGDPFMLHQPQL